MKSLSATMSETGVVVLVAGFVVLPVTLIGQVALPHAAWGAAQAFCAIAIGAGSALVLFGALLDWWTGRNA